MKPAVRRPAHQHQNVTPVEYLPATWERRWHPLRREWVTITSHRNKRPWSSSEVEATVEAGASYDASCYLCPGNTRVSGEKNPDYTGIFVFDNDHPSFVANPDIPEPPGDTFFLNGPVHGSCRVICYSPDHSASLASLPLDTVVNLVDTWADETAMLTSREDIACVSVFENKGEVVGVSNPHPHGQIYATSFVPDAFARESEAQLTYFSEHGRALFDDMIAAELRDDRRMVVSNAAHVAFVPYFARFPYEVYVSPQRRVGYVYELSADERASFAATLQEVLIRYDNLWRTDFPYIMMLHQAPCDGSDQSHYHFHIQIHPLMRAPGLQKFLAGIETGAGHFLNDGCPEDKAAELRAVSAIHYRRELG